jgi:inosine/xanthosine triphosphate pyrophosphatase family protein
VDGFHGEYQAMTDDEKTRLGRAVGAIITEGDQGFVYGTLFESPEEYKQSCAEIISTLIAQDEG